MTKALQKIKANYFSSWLNSLITLVLVGLIAVIVVPLVQWMIIDATWTGSSVKDCHGGACWAFVGKRLDQFIYGFYPVTERYRVNLAGLTFILGLAQWWLPRISMLVKGVISFVATGLLLALLIGGFWGLPYVPTDVWGGLFLTLLLAFGSIIASFPIAMMLALGRFSQMMIVKSICVTFIEVVRGVPLITVLFMASVMLPLFLPQGVDINKLLRAFVGITLFQAAYLAEVIRGGLKAVPKGQFEAAQSLGLSYWPMMGLIILPQALKTMIPGIVNTFIALFKDTTLVLIIGLFDFLGMVQAATTDPNWLGTAFEGYVFCALIYWAFCFSMSQYSRHLERKYHTGHHDDIR